MENLDIIILTIVLSTVFVVFIAMIFEEFKNTPKQFNNLLENNPNINLINFLNKLFDKKSKSKTKKEQQKIYKVIRGTISDMENEGIYFPKEVVEKLKKYKEEMNCEYSNLPSIKSYKE